MKIDLYTKIILTIIAIGIFIPMLGNSPVTNKARAFVGGGEMILNFSSRFYHLKDGKVRLCKIVADGNIQCNKWSN